jgi:hypothetical protein
VLRPSRFPQGSVRARHHRRSQLTDDTQGLVYDFCADNDMRYVVLTPGPKREKWRDCGAVLNYGIRAAAGDYILLTHPEVMPGRRSVAECVSRLAAFEVDRKWWGGSRSWLTDKDHPLPIDRGPVPFGMYACCKPYYLTPRDQERIDTVDWLNTGPLAVRQIEGFYEHEQHKNGNPDYSPWSIESIGKPGAPHTHWLSWVFGGCSRKTWRMMGGMLETGKWGSVDVAFVQRRRTLGIANHTCIEDDTLCCHQNHDDPAKNVITPRIEEMWKQELAGIPLHDVEKMTEDRLGWRS